MAWVLFFNLVSNGVFLHLDDPWNVVFTDDVPESSFDSFCKFSLVFEISLKVLCQHANMSLYCKWQQFVKLATRLYVSKKSKIIIVFYKINGKTILRVSSL